MSFSMPWQSQSQQVTPRNTQQPEAYQVVLKIQGLAQAPVSVQPSHGQPAPGKPQTVRWSACASSGRVRVPAATPSSAPVAA